MNRLSRINMLQLGLATLTACISGLAIAGEVQGDTLLIERVQAKPADLPSRGMSMAQVEARYGAPGNRLDPRGGQKQAWPTIHRWAYPAFTVYFERSKVIDVVVNKADPDEIGPKPAAR